MKFAADFKRLLTQNNYRVIKRQSKPLDAIKQIKGNLGESWRSDRFAFDVFKAAINELLDLISNIHPKSETQPSTVAKFQAMYGPDEKPETIGRMLRALRAR